MPAHTAGPWTHSYSQISGAHYISSRVNPFESYHVVTLSVNDQLREPTKLMEAECAANARLITAAPDLYAALRCLHDAYIAPAEIGTDGKARMWHAITQARDAMAKAESRP